MLKQELEDIEVMYNICAGSKLDYQKATEALGAKKDT